MLTRATEKPDASAARKDRRLRAVYRRDLQNSVRLSAFIVVAGIAASGTVKSVISPAAAIGEISMAVALCLISLAIAYAASCRLRRYVVVLGIAVGLLPVVAMALGMIIVPQSQEMVVATTGMIPVAFAVFVPLARRPYFVFVVLAVVLFGAPPILFPQSPMWNSLSAFLIAGSVGCGLGFGMNDLQLRRREQMNGQLLAMRELYGRMKDHELDLRRQDEFLFMQQETLVVQQAELLRLNEELETIARLDALTGLGNRLRLNEDLAQVAARIERSGGSVGLLLMDLDRFKRLNDVAGHLAGDAALRGVADVLRKTSRVGDGLYRYGGEEFLVILHDCDESVLESVGQRYISAVEAACMPHPDNPPWTVVTASAGAREMSQRNCTDIDSALHDADEALYEAKAMGRNRLIIHRDSIVPLDRRRAAS